MIKQQKPYYELQSYETEVLSDYFKQNGIIIPVETLIQKYREKDYRFFIEQKNFNLVVDSLEKF